MLKKRIETNKESNQYEKGRETPKQTKRRRRDLKDREKLKQVISVEKPLN